MHMQTAVLVVPMFLALQAGGRPPVAPMPAATAAASAAVASANPAGVDVPTDYVIGPDDVLGIVFWKDKDLSTDVTVRPDGMITLPLLPEIKASGLTPEELRTRVLQEAKRFVESPTASVIVKQINSRKVYITGQVVKPGAYPLTTQMTVMQLIALAGGLREFAKDKEILIVRTVNGQPVPHRFNYEDVVKKQRFTQNIMLLPGDTVVVP